MLFNKDLVDIALKTCWYIRKTERHYLVFEVAVPSAKDRLLLITFSNSHLIIDTSQVQVGELFCSS